MQSVEEGILLSAAREEQKYMFLPFSPLSLIPLYFFFPFFIGAHVCVAG
jgi:hypothetical protein